MHENKPKLTGIKYYADLPTAQEMFSVGRKAIEEIAKEAGATVKIGRRRLYSVEKMRAYLDSLTE